MPTSLPTSLVAPPASGKRLLGPRQAACAPSLAGFLALVLGLLAALPLLAQRPAGPASLPASNIAVSPQLAAKLRAPLRTAVAASPLRASLTQIATLAEVNLWIDRRVDPSLPVTVAAGPKSVFEAISQAARSVGLEAVAAGSVVVVGRPQWAHQLAGAILDLPVDVRQTADAPPIDWPPLTTPNRAINLSLGGDAADTLALPHDLWPAVSWRGVSPQLAILLITAQFDLMPSEPLPAPPQASAADLPAAEPGSLLFSRDPRLPSTSAAGSDSSSAAPAGGESSASSPRSGPQRSVGLRPLTAPPSVACAHPNGPHVTRLRAAARAADPKCRFRTGRPGEPLELIGSPAAHVAATAAYLSLPEDAAADAAVDVDATRFSLRLRDAPASDVLAQLAATAGRQLRISPAAEPACRQRVTFEGRDVTLAELAQQVAAAVGLRATWTDQSLQIDLEP